MRDETNVLHGPPHITKDFNQSLGQLLLHQLRVHGSNVAQVNAHTGEVQTFNQILTDTVKLAIYLERAQVKVNDCVAICSENRLEFCIPLCATLYLGATVCPVNPLYTEKELKHALKISRPKYIFVSPVSVNIMQKTVKEFAWSPKLILMYDTDTDIGLQSLRTLISGVNDIDINKFQAHDVDINNHVAAILCSSGTTGLSKGVMLSDRNILTIIRNNAEFLQNAPSTSSFTLSLLPFFHAYCFCILVVRLITGAKSVILSRFEEETFLRTIEKYKIESLHLVPPLLVFLAKHPFVDRYNLSCVKEIWSGAAPLPKEIRKTVEKRLNIQRIHEGYGLTETTLAVLHTRGDTFRDGSVGKLTPGTSGKVIPIGEDVPKVALGPNCVGELCFKGDQIMKGYCSDVSSTKKIIDKDGWLHTGDVGYYDEDGFFFLVDRLKELIKYKGYQVQPAELEEILLMHPGIKDAAVIGIPDEEAGELPAAFVVKQDRYDITEDEIVSYVNERVSPHKRIRGGVKFVEAIPKTASGKILKKDLRQALKSKL